MESLQYFKISMFIHVDDDADSEPVEFEISFDEGLTISRKKTDKCNKNPNKFPEIEGFDVNFNIEHATRLRDFLNFALPND